VAGGIKPGKIVEIEHRLYQQLIVGKQKACAMLDDIDTELEAAAHKLDVEREATLERLAKQIQARQTFEAISSQLTSTVNNAIEHQLASPEAVLASANISDKQILLLEILQSKNVDLNRLRLVIQDLSWLTRDLCNMVNSPSFRHRRPRNLDVQVTDLKLVLNYIGLENLKILIPYYCLRNWLPSGNANLLWTTRKLWRFSIVCGIAAQALAKLHNLDVSFVYSASLLSQLGTSVVLSNSARLFEKTWGRWLREASASRDKELYDAVIATEFPSELVFKQVLAYGSKLNWQLLGLLKFEDSQLTTVLHELDQKLNFSELSATAAIIAKAGCFAKVQLLEELRQLEPQEKRLMFDYFELSEQEVLRLKAQNYRKMNVI
jgi:hypothetical protein